MIKQHKSTGETRKKGERGKITRGNGRGLELMRVRKERK
jgi:hypothetical protein